MGTRFGFAFGDQAGATANSFQRGILPLPLGLVQGASGAKSARQVPISGSHRENLKKALELLECVSKALLTSTPHKTEAEYGQKTHALFNRLLTQGKVYVAEHIKGGDTPGGLEAAYDPRKKRMLFKEVFLSGAFHDFCKKPQTSFGQQYGMLKVINLMLHEAHHFYYNSNHDWDNGAGREGEDGKVPDEKAGDFVVALAKNTKLIYERCCEGKLSNAEKKRVLESSQLRSAEASLYHKAGVDYLSAATDRRAMSTDSGRAKAPDMRKKQKKAEATHKEISDKLKKEKEEETQKELERERQRREDSTYEGEERGTGGGEAPPVSSSAVPVWAAGADVASPKAEMSILGMDAEDAPELESQGVDQLDYVLEPAVQTMLSVPGLATAGGVVSLFGDAGGVDGDADDEGPQPEPGAPPVGGEPPGGGGGLEFEELIIYDPRTGERYIPGRIEL